MSLTPAKTTSKKTLTDRDVGIVPVREIKTKQSFLIYGRSGTGKTTLASTFPGPMLLLDFKDEGTDSVADVKGLSVRQIEDLDDLEEIYWYLKDNPGKFKTIILDTLTQLQQMIVEKVAGSKKKDKAGMWGSMTQRQWGDVSQAMKKWITLYRDLGRDGTTIVFLAQVRMFNVPETGEDENALIPEVGGAMSPAVRSHVNAAVIGIANTFIRVKMRKKEKKQKAEFVYSLRVGPHPTNDTKWRKPRGAEIPDYIDNPVYEDLMEIIRGEA